MSTALVALVGDRRLRVVGFHADGAPIVAEGALVVSLEEVACAEGVDPAAVEIVEERGAW